MRLQGCFYFNGLSKTSAINAAGDQIGDHHLADLSVTDRQRTPAIIGGNGSVAARPAADGLARLELAIQNVLCHHRDGPADHSIFSGSGTGIGLPLRAAHCRFTSQAMGKRS